MKITDYCPRAAPFDSYLPRGHLVGVEVGVDVGAHAEALLRYCPIQVLHLVDPWPNIERKGYCDGRLSRFRGKYEMLRMTSLEAAAVIKRGDSTMDGIDFVYLDQEHDRASVAADLAAWWPLLRAGGVLGHRNYVENRGAPLDMAIEEFVARNKIRTKVERYGADIILWKP
jgi:hypothetical protein